MKKLSQEVRQDIIKEMLADPQGNRTKLADKYGVSRGAVYDIAKEMDLVGKTTTGDYGYLKEFCSTARQRELLAAYIQEDNNTAKAAKLLKITASVVQRLIRMLKERAAKQGQAPGHFDNGVAPGFEMGKVTVQRGADGTIERIWERQSPNQLEAQQAILDAIVEHANGIAPIVLPALTSDCDQDLCTIYPIADIHIGMLCWAKETGAPWDLDIATEVLVNALVRLAAGSPNSEQAVLVLLGDFVHWDGIDAVTPTAHNILDSDIRFQKLQKAALEVVEKAVEIIARKHKRVRVIQCEGNHDLASSSWLRVVLSRIFRDDPRISIDETPMPYHAFLHGDVMIGFHHGHRKQGKNLPGIFASEPRFRKMWGQATHTYIHTGHLHSSELYISDSGGAVVERHPTLAARDAYTTGIGAVAVRACRAITYHKKFGEVQRTTVAPEYSPKNKRVDQ